MTFDICQTVVCITINRPNNKNVLFWPPILFIENNLALIVSSQWAMSLEGYTPNTLVRSSTSSSSKLKHKHTFLKVYKRPLKSSLIPSLHFL